MSEHGVGAAEREALDRAQACVIAQRRAYYGRLAAIAAVADLGTAGATGYRSTESLFADRDNLDAADAKRLVAEAADLCARSSLLGEPLPARLPCTGAALAAGVIDPAHVKIIRETMAKLSGLAAPPPPDEWCGVERALAREAQGLPPRMLRQLANGFVAFYDPDGAAPPDGEDDFDELRLHRRRDGSLVFKGRLGDPMDAEMVIEVFGVLSAPAGAEDERGLVKRNADAFKDLVQDARGPRGLATDARNGTDDPETESAEADGPTDGDGAPGRATDADDAVDEASNEAARTEGSREEPSGAAHTEEPGEQSDEEPGEPEAHSDAPLALIPEPRRARSTATNGWTERPGRALLTVTIDHRWLCEALADKGGYGTLDSGHHVDAATVRRWACDAEIVPMVLGSRSEPLDVGRTQRTATDAIRRALNIRDGGCAFPGCDRTPRRCQAHHIGHWRDLGDTAVHNMCLLCRYHHHLMHHGHWTIHMIDGRPWFTPPTFIDPEQRPRPGGRPRVPL